MIKKTNSNDGEFTRPFNNWIWVKLDEGLSSYVAHPSFGLRMGIQAPRRKVEGIQQQVDSEGTAFAKGKCT